MINAHDLASKTPNELAKMATELRAEIRELRFKISSRQHSKVHGLSQVKRDLARVLTAAARAKNSSSSQNV